MPALKKSTFIPNLGTSKSIDGLTALVELDIKVAAYRLEILCPVALGYPPDNLVGQDVKVIK